MVLTLSTMLPLGTKAPDFQLQDVVTNSNINLDTFKTNNALLIMFICRHCPYVQHVKDEISRIGRDFLPQNLGILAISSNDPVRYPEDHPSSLREFSEQQKFGFPLCFDATQAVAKAYTAACTPDYFLFDKDRKLVYRGQLDDSRPGNGLPITGRNLRSAIEAVLSDQTIPVPQKPSMGCNIKWKPGNEPAFFPH